MADLPKCSNRICNRMCDQMFYCPTCKKHGKKVAFCSNDCFKAMWRQHKVDYHDHLPQPETSSEPPPTHLLDSPICTYVGQFEVVSGTSRPHGRGNVTYKKEPKQYFKGQFEHGEPTHGELVTPGHTKYVGEVKSLHQQIYKGPVPQQGPVPIQTRVIGPFSNNLNPAFLIDSYITPNGKGVLEEADGQVIKGRFADGLPAEGKKMKLYDLGHDQSRYHGELSLSFQRQGQGKQIYRNGDEFEGTWHENNRVRGKLTGASKQTTCEGEWRNSTPTQAVLKTRALAVVTVVLATDSTQSKKVLGEHASFTYEGAFKAGEAYVPHGHGKLTNSFGAYSFTGAFRDGKIDGKGTLTEHGVVATGTYKRDFVRDYHLPAGRLESSITLAPDAYAAFDEQRLAELIADDASFAAQRMQQLNAMDGAGRGRVTGLTLMSSLSAVQTPGSLQRNLEMDREIELEREQE